MIDDIQQYPRLQSLPAESSQVSLFKQQSSQGQPPQGEGYQQQYPQGKVAPNFQKVNTNSNLSGKIRSCNEDFQVDEIQQFTPSGSGEHVWLKIKKSGENTDWVAKHLAQIAAVPRRDVSYAGMKDRNAISTQWFSVQMPGREAPNWQAGLESEGLPSVQVLEEYRHDRKLKRGALKGNQFKLTLRDFEGSETELAASITRIKTQGVPNYFGIQRFGHSCLNISKAEQWFSGEFKVKDRNRRSIYLSAARSWVFNHILSARVANGSWNQAMTGDVCILNGSNSCFSLNAEDGIGGSIDGSIEDSIEARMDRHDIHPSGALWGRGRLASGYEVAELEENIANKFTVLCGGLEVNGLKKERRALRLVVKHIEYRMLDAHTVSLAFSLPQGTYATTVLAELGVFS